MPFSITNVKDFSVKKAGKGIVWLIFALLFVYLFRVASFLKIDYSDSFETFLNSLSFIHRTDLVYSYWRPLLFPALFSPLFLIEQRLGLEDFAFMLSHWGAVGFFALTLIALYKLFRFHLNETSAFMGTFLFALNPLLIHMAPFDKEDIPGALFTILVFYFYLKGLRSEKLWDFVKSGLCMTLAIDTRRNLIPSFVVMILFELSQEGFCLTFSRKNLIRASGKLLKAKIGALWLLPLCLFLLTPAIFYPLMGHASFWGAPLKFLKEIIGYYKAYNATYSESPTEVYTFLVKSFTWPLILCGAMGLILSLKKRHTGALFHFFWLFVFLLSASFVIPHKEARFLSPLFPPLYFFVMRGIEEGFLFLDRRIVSRHILSFVKTAGMAFLSILPLHNAARECVRFQDPIYTSTFEKEVSLYAKMLAGNHSLYWVGTFYALHPKDYIFDPADEFTYFYHFFAHHVAFYAKRPYPFVIGSFDLFQPAGHPEAVFLGPKVESVIHDGDVLIINPDPKLHSAAEPPMKEVPIVVARSRQVSFEPQPDLSQTHLFKSTQFQSAQMRVSPTPKGYLIQGREIPRGMYALYQKLEGKDKPLFLAYVDAREGQFDMQQNQPGGEALIGKLMLIYYDSVRRFTT